MAYGPPGLQNTILPGMPRMLPALKLPMGPGVQPQGPTGLAALLAKPGLRDALLAAGSALLQQADQPGSIGGALGNALPVGFQAFQNGKQNAEIDALMESAPPEMRQLLKALPSRDRVGALLEMMKPPQRLVVGKNDRVLEGDKVVLDALPEAEDPFKGLSSDMRDALFAMGADPATMTPEQKQAALALSDQLRKSSATNVNVGKEVSDLPVGMQGGVVASQGVRDALNRFEGYAKEWLAMPVGKRALGQLGVPDEKRDVLLGNMQSVRQELVLNLKNLAELGVLAGPDMDILNEMIGDPASKEALVRSPEFMLTRIERVREYVDNKINAYERTYGIEVPKDGSTKASGAPKTAEGATLLRLLGK